MEGLLQKVKELAAKFSDVEAEAYASSIAYFSFLSLMPSLAICISLVSLVGISEHEVAAFFTALVPDAFDDFVRMLIGDAFGRSGIAFSLSTVTLLWSASMGVKALRRGLNAAYAVEESRSVPVVAAISVFASLILGVLLAAVMYLIFSGSVVRAISKILPDLGWQVGASGVIDPVLALVVGMLVLGACYAYLPAGTRRFASQLPGAALASLACGALSLGFHEYVEHFVDYTVLYGGIATVALFLYWMYLVSYVLVAGGFVNRVLSEAGREH